MEPCILRAAATGNIDEGKTAMDRRPSCINDVDEHNMNALQIAIASMQTDFGLFILDNTEVSSFICFNEDKNGRNANMLALIAGTQELKKAVSERIAKEYELWWDIEDKKDAELAKSFPNTPKPKL